MTEARVGLSLEIQWTNISLNLRLTRAKVTHDLKLGNSTFGGNICLDSAEIGGNVEPTNIVFAANPEKERNRCDQPESFRPGISFVDLTSARIGKMLFWNASGDYTVELDGLTYQRLGNVENQDIGKDEMKDAEHNETSSKDRVNSERQRKNHRLTWIDWVERDKTFTPQPYQQLATVFRTSGDSEGADKALYLAREHTKEQAWEDREYKRYGILFLSKWIISYGIGFYFLWVLIPVAVVTFSGAFVLCLSQNSARPARPASTTHSTSRLNNQPPTKFLHRLAFSLHHLLPVIELERSFDEVKLSGFARWYFYAHRLIGWLLGSFLVAALAGLTQGR